MAATERARPGGAVLLIALLLAILPAGKALAEDYFNAQLYSHGFNNDVSVYSGVFALNKDVTLSTSTYLKYTVDFINPDFGFDGHEGGDDDDDDAESAKAGTVRVAAVSGASSASVSSSASDTRHEITAGVAHDFTGDFGVEAYYDYSREEDFSSSTPTVSITKDLFQKNTTLTFGYSRNMETVDGKFLGGARDRDSDNYFFGVTQVLSPLLVARAGYTRTVSEGEMTEGIRLVAVDGEDPANCTVETATCLDELHPDSRRRESYILGFARYFAEGPVSFVGRSALHLNLRYYEDDWKISSYTGEAAWYKYLSDSLIMRLNFRYYTQQSAFFVKDAYLGTDPFRTSSPQLEEFDTRLYGVKLAKAFDGPSSGSIEGKYEFYRESTGVNAHVLMGGVRIVF